MRMRATHSLDISPQRHSAAEPQALSSQLSAGALRARSPRESLTAKAVRLGIKDLRELSMESLQLSAISYQLSASPAPRRGSTERSHCAAGCARSGPVVRRRSARPIRCYRWIALLQVDRFATGGSLCYRPIALLQADPVLQVDRL